VMPPKNWIYSLCGSVVLRSTYEYPFSTKKNKLTEYLSLVHSRHWIYSFFSVQ
jgi:hypothetical protein